MGLKERASKGMIEKAREQQAKIIAEANAKAARIQTKSRAVRVKGDVVSPEEVGANAKIVDAVWEANRELLTKQEAREMVKCVLGTVAAILKKDNRVDLIDMGVLKIVQRKARVGRNPQTKKKINIPAKKAVVFSAGKSLKAAVN